MHMQPRTEAEAVFFTEFGDPCAAPVQNLGGNPFGHENYFVVRDMQIGDESPRFGQIRRSRDHELKLILIVRDEPAEDIGLNAQTLMLRLKSALRG